MSGPHEPPPRAHAAPLAALAGAALTLLVAPAVRAQTIVVDDEDGAPAFTLTGNDWTTWGSNGYGFDGGDAQYHYLSHTVGGPDRRGTATWRPTLPTAGTWAIATWWRRTSNRTSDADHFIHDGAGGVTHIVLNQQGSGASGWVDLGTYPCAAGPSGCYVVLDGTDDDQSDAANAVRFVLVQAAEGPPATSAPCDGPPAPGTYTVEAFADSVSGSGWTGLTAAEGPPNGQEATTPNVDAGEALVGAGFDLCDPGGGAQITAVEVAARARTQYASGQYRLDLRLDAGGAAASLFTGTSLASRTLDVTGDRAAWTFPDAASLALTVSLGGQPGGNRDSDAWVDAFRVAVTYVVPEPPPADPPDPPPGEEPPPDPPDDPPSDDPPADDPPAEEPPEEPAGDDDDSAADEEPVGPFGPLQTAGSTPAPAPGGCAQSLDGGIGLAALLALPLATRRRRGAL